VLVLLHGGVLAGLCRFFDLLVVIQACVFWQRFSSEVLAACCHTSVCLLAEVFLLSPCLLVFTSVCLLFCFCGPRLLPPKSFAGFFKPDRFGRGCYLLSPLLALSSLIACLLSYKRVSFGRGFPPKSLLACCHTSVCLLFCFVGRGCYLLSPLLALSSLIIVDLVLRV
jgi:hypothetical protein